jgi:hypothetical protein
MFVEHSQERPTMTVAADRPGYAILIPSETAARAAGYLASLRAGAAVAGARLADRLRGRVLSTLTAEELLGELLETKHARIFAESEVGGDGSDWNLVELGLLGDVSVAVPCTIYDDARHTRWITHVAPFPGTLVYTPGALLRNDRGLTPADWNAVVGDDGQLRDEAYDALYLRRLLPVFAYVNEHAAKPRSAVLTIPGLGCGQFAGKFRGKLGDKLQRVLERLLAEHGEALPNLKAVYFDPYSECANTRREIHGISFMVRPLTMQPGGGKSQLCHPSAYAEPGDDFSGCSLSSIVAWDHVSWPGNDFYGDARSTDDGVKAAATSSMQVLTGVTGTYDGIAGKYKPPKECRSWAEVVEQGRAKRGLRLWKPAAVWGRASSGQGGRERGDAQSGESIRRDDGFSGTVADKKESGMHERAMWEHDEFFHAWWADTEGRVLAGEYPGHRGDDDNTQQKLSLLEAAGVRTIIDLTHEADRLSPYEQHFPASADGGATMLRRLSHPIPDVSVTTAEHYDRIVADIEAELAAGRKVFIHCWGGVGRTGTVVGIWHVHRGLDPDTALERIAAARRGTRKEDRDSPETSEQREAIRAAYARRHTDDSPGGRRA